MFAETCYCMSKEFNCVAFSEAVRAKRFVDLKIGLRELAKMVKISPATLSRVENGGMPDVNTLINVCEWLQQPISNFVVNKGRRQTKKSEE